jgi:hypothetical protein
MTNTWEKQLKWGKIHSGLWISEVSVLSHLTPSLWACGKEELHDREGVLEHRYSPHGSWQTEREKGAVDKIHLSKTCFLQRHPTSGSFHHFPIMPSNYISVLGLFHLLGQIPHNHLSMIGSTSWGLHLEHMSLLGDIISKS